MNRKGFTLIELLAVIVILSSISIVAVSSLTKSLNDRSIKECKEQIGLAKNEAKIYFSLHPDETSVKISTLINDFNVDKKLAKLKDDGQIIISNDQYIYDGYDNNSIADEETRVSSVCDMK